MNQPDVLEKRPVVGLISLDNILFATDFSSSSFAALPHAVAVARRYGSKIFIAHAVQPHPYPLVSGETITYLDELVQGAEKELKDLSKSPLLKDIEHISLLGHGEIIEVLSKFLAGHKVDLVITGTHGRRGFRRFFLGSVAEEIFRTSPCPVLTVGPHVPHEAPQKMALHHVLFPTDLSPESLAAVRYALSFAVEYAARLTILHVMHDAGRGPAWQAAKICYDKMQALIPEEVRPWCEADCLVETGDRAEIILRIAKERQADLIALGLQKASSLVTHRMSNIAYRVVTEATCPVLTVRDQFSPTPGAGKAAQN
jgi:nucleotide-binding universal stress UspA family protein